MGYFGANFGGNFAAYATISASDGGVVLEGNHGKTFYGDARFDKIRKRAERLYRFPVTAQIVRTERLPSLTGVIERTHKLPSFKSRILKLNEFYVTSRISRTHERFMEANVIDKENGKVYRTISETLDQLKADAKRAKISRMLKEYKDEYN